MTKLGRSFRPGRAAMIPLSVAVLAAWTVATVDPINESQAIDVFDSAVADQIGPDMEIARVGPPGKTGWPYRPFRSQRSKSANVA